MWLLAALAPMHPAAESQGEDVESLRRIVSGDQGAAAVLYDRHARPLYSLILRILGDEGEAEDVLQEVFVQAFRQAGRYDASRGAVAAWLLMMARSRAIDRLRARRSRVEGRTGEVQVLNDLPDAQPDVASALLDEEQARLVREALAELPLLQRLAIELAYYEGLSHTEIATRLEQPLGTVKTRIRLGLLKLRDVLAEGQA
ncbi:MAG TPA: sigma-70 family RNA polymerase sigma factor [Vicinamibacterales bacterium]|jgi:RNA polymerase sigma-70 factor (ECF subfamily)|nr:sigma-70 family RNA polymerase sigma factor [Vicinamibacterales bacterium]